ncbi:hypothetical protein [Pediococcus pentosaceus]|nr:hypothetical protein [Pediococcus pentosaceus]
MKITYKTHDNLEINPGQISILGTNSSTVYTEYNTRITGRKRKN